MNTSWLTKYPITWTFAQHVQAGGLSATYPGVDFGLPNGTPVYAIESGFMQCATDANGSNYIWLQGSTGAWVYVHLSSFEGGNRNVKEGDLIGYSGNTGYSFGPHLHLGFYRNGGYVDCLPFLNLHLSNNSNNNSYNANMETYTVRSGDSPARIVLNMGLPDSAENMNALAQLNGYANYEVMRVSIQPGQVIKLRASVAPQPIAESVINTDSIKNELKTQYDADKSKLDKKYQDEIITLNIRSSIEIATLKEEIINLEDKIADGELKSRADIVGKEFRIKELEAEIEAKKSFVLNIEGKIEPLAGAIINISSLVIQQYGIKAKWHAFVDRTFPSEGTLDVFFRGLLKFDIAWIVFYSLTGFGSVLTVFQNTLGENQKTLLVVSATLLALVGAIIKFLATNVDKNKDGKVDIDDTEFLKQVTK